MPDFDFDFSHIFDPTAEGIVVIGMILPILAVLLAVAALVPLLLLRRMQHHSRRAVAAILIGDCLLLVLSTGFGCLMMFRPLGLIAWILLPSFLMTLKTDLDSAWLSVTPEIGTPQVATDSVPIPKKLLFPWFAGIASITASLSVVGIGLMFLADPSGDHLATQILTVLLALLMQVAGVVCLVVSIMVAITAPRRLRVNGASRGTVALSRLAWLYPGSIVLVGLGSALVFIISLILRERAFDSFGPLGSLTVLIPLLCLLILFPTAGVICLASAYLRHAKEKKRSEEPIAQDGEQGSRPMERTVVP